MSVSLKRHGRLEAVTIQALTGLDGQGKPAYGTGTVVQAHVERTRQVIRTGTGSEVEIMATLWVDGAAAALPTSEGRVTLADGLVGIIMTRDEGRDLQANALDHVVVQLRQE
jgi:hypothetical protein